MSELRIERVSIVELDTDCIVNAANERLLEGGGVCGVIFRAAGARELQAACDRCGGCRTGDAVITPGFRLKAKYIVHAVGPIWQGGGRGEGELLYRAYQSAMRRAMENECHSIAFPLISSGIFGYPKKEAWKIAVTAITDFQTAHRDNTLDAVIAVLDAEAEKLGGSILSGN